VDAPEIILGFRLGSDGRISVVGPDGVEVRCAESDLGAEVRRRLATDGIAGVVTSSAGATKEQLRKAYGVLYEYVRDIAGDHVGPHVVKAAETVVIDVHRRIREGAPKGCSRKWKMRQQRKAIRGT
jgi:hypothetical protein